MSGSSIQQITGSPQATSLIGGQSRVVFTINWTADNANGSVPSLTIPMPQPAFGEGGLSGWYLLCMETASGTTAPSSGYGVTVTDDLGVDLLLGNGANLPATPHAVMPASWVPVMANLSVNISGNSVNSAGGTIRLIFTTN